MPKPAGEIPTHPEMHRPSRSPERALRTLRAQAKARQLQTFNEVRDQVRLIADPFFEVLLSEDLLELGPQLPDALAGLMRGHLVAKPRMSHGCQHMCHPVVRHGNLLEDGQRLGVVPLAIFIEEKRVVIPTGMMRAEVRSE